VGDVNLFLSEDEEDDDENEDEHDSKTTATVTNAPLPDNPQPPKRIIQAELDIMIAEDNCRGKGLGKEASCLMMLYGAKSTSIRRFFCKVKETNEASLALFQKHLGFEQCAYAACFKEYELERKYETSEQMIQEVTKTIGENFEWKTFSCTLQNGK